MKKNLFLSIATLLVSGGLFTACNNDDENPVTTSPVTRLTATLNGQQEKPVPVTTTATGTFAGDLNETTRVLSYTVTHTIPASATLVGGHLHRIVPNATNGLGPVEIPFSNLTSPITGQTTLTSQARVDSMKNGFYYANLHTRAYPAGEIRGDIKK